MVRGATWAERRGGSRQEAICGGITEVRGFWFGVVAVARMLVNVFCGAAVAWKEASVEE